MIGRILDWNYGLGAILVIVAAMVLLLGGFVWLSLALWPKDAHGNPLPCTRYVTETVYVTEHSGNSTYIIPVQTQVCVEWASPSPSEKG